MPVNAALQGKRAALPSATIMLRQPIQRFQQMQASDIDIYRNELRKTNAEIVRHCSACSIPRSGDANADCSATGFPPPAKGGRRPAAEGCRTD